MRTHFDLEAIKAALRTAGALMFGNSFVGYFVLDKRDLLNLLTVATIGVTVILVASRKKGA